MYAIDIETYDPNIEELGDGAVRHDGEIICVGTYNGHDSPKCYRPTDPTLLEILSSSEPKVFHNGVYDLSWLVLGYNLPVNGKIEDTMTREALLDEYADGLKLDDCCKRRGITGKNYDDTVEVWWKSHGGKGKAIKHLKEIPWEVVAAYCEQDVVATYNLFVAQQPFIEAEDLQRVNDMESDLYPILLDMKRTGIRVDTAKRDALRERWEGELADRKLALYETYGLKNINSPKQVKEKFNSLGIHSAKKTDTGNESYDSEALESIGHPLAGDLAKAKAIDKALGTFIVGAFTNHCVNGRVHSTLVPTQRDEGGTITGRFGCRSPNLQNVPSKEKTFGPEIRSLLLPEEDHILCAWDYKQIEYVLFIHYAIGPGAEAARKSVCDGVDYHTMTQRLVGWEDPDTLSRLHWTPEDARKMTKTLNFGILYGLGLDGFIEMFKSELQIGADSQGVPIRDYAERIRETYFTNVPFVKPTVNGIRALLRQKGFIRSIGGRIHRRPKRKGDFAIVNYFIQGGASDILKRGMIDAHKAGIFNEVKFHLTVHDENVFSAPYTAAGAEAAEYFARIMEKAIALKVPVRVDREAGPDWGHCDARNFYVYKMGVRKAPPKEMTA